jgi:hypothetical protein
MYILDVMCKLYNFMKSCSYNKRLSSSKSYISIDSDEELENEVFLPN